MLIILLFVALSRTLSINGATLSTQSPPHWHSEPLIREVPDTQAHFGQRTVNDIIISCFATIFACTWSAIHPNIPSPADCWWTRFKRQFVTALYALLAPELITVWALRQYWAAKEVVNDYNYNMRQYIIKEFPTHTSSVRESIRRLFQDSNLANHIFQEGIGSRWTLTHGFFLQMGGFVMCANGHPFQTLHGDKSHSGIMYNIQKGVIDPPRVSEEDIKDRSKGDTISKTLIILQTSWFIVQCIARWSHRLPVTELEVVTLGFALLNGITYALWWNKPQNIGRPIFLEIKSARETDKTFGVECDDPGPQANTNAVGESSSPDAVLVVSRVSSIQPDIELDSDSDIIETAETWMRRKLRSDIKESPTWKLLWRVPLLLVKISLHPLAKLSSPTIGGPKRRSLRVNMFSSPDSDFFKLLRMLFSIAAIGTLFGCVHLLPSWFLAFSSRQEMWLWRASAIIITAEPILGGLYVHSTRTRYSNFLIPIMKIPFIFIGLPLYLISRVILLILALTSLRSLPTAALQTIEWTTYIPHL